MKSRFETINLQIQDNIATLTLNRPESLNSINLLMHSELKSALKKISNSNVRAMVLQAKGRGFCSGQDLTERSSDEAPNLGVSLEERYNPLIQSIFNLSFPTVCAVNGVAAGAGVSLALCCDFILIDESTKFIPAFSKIGLVPDSGMTWLLPKIIGFTRAKLLMMLGESINAEQALNWGLAWQKHPKEELSNAACALVQQLVQMPTMSLSLIKHATLNSYTSTLEEQLDLERDMQQYCGRTNDYREGINAFLTKTKPVFKGK